MLTTLSVAARRQSRRVLSSASRASATTRVTNTNSSVSLDNDSTESRGKQLRWQSSAPNQQSAAPGETSETEASTGPAGTPLMDRSEKGVFERMFDKYSLTKQTNRILVAESYLQAAIQQASDPRWFGPGRIARDFRSYQAILTMHVWFLHKRLIMDKKDPHAAGLIQEELFDIFWTDSSNRMRAHGVQELMIQKNLKTVQQYTFMHCFHYDHCYTELLDKPKERLAELKNLVQTHILLLDPEENPQSLDVHDDHAERIAWYIEAQYQNIIHDMPESWFDRSRIAWVDLPDFSNMKDDKGNVLEEIPIDAEDILPTGWIKNIANDGTTYYWNTETRQAQWERPL